MTWLEPWVDLTTWGRDSVTTFERVLDRELAPGHVLHGLPVAAVGKRDGTDDVLFRLLDGSERVAVVHLTWTQSPPERPPWPATEVYTSFEEFTARRMRPDHEEVAEEPT
jgi:hypothetical protein